jgi:hypothetical protein
MLVMHLQTFQNFEDSSLAILSKNTFFEPQGIGCAVKPRQFELQSGRPSLYFGMLNTVH